ncbi:hypothetical protein H0H93_009210, partial [Arthromyces matolae]
MGSTVLGLLRMTNNLLRLADSKYSDTLDGTLSRITYVYLTEEHLRSSELRCHALSNLLTLFSHDIPTLPLIQHVFDYILCRPPIIIVYLVTAIILCRKELIQKYEDEDEDESLGMCHSLLSALPPMVDEEMPVVLNPDGDVEGVDGVLRDERVKVEEAPNADDATEKSPDSLLEGDALPDDETNENHEAPNANDATEKSPDALRTDKVPKLQGDALSDDEGSSRSPTRCPMETWKDSMEFLETKESKLKRLPTQNDATEKSADGLLADEVPKLEGDALPDDQTDENHVSTNQVPEVTIVSASLLRALQSPHASRTTFPTFPSTHHVFNYILCRPSVIIAYLVKQTFFICFSGTSDAIS